MKLLKSRVAELLDVQNQGHRGTCMAFAATNAHSAAIRKQNWLSAEYLYQRSLELIGAKKFSQGLTAQQALDGLDVHGQPDWSSCPYQLVEEHMVTRVPFDQLAIRYSRGTVLDPKIDIITHDRFDGGLFVLMIELMDDFFRAPFPAVLQDGGTPRKPRAFHAVILSALGQDDSDQPIYQIKNSWGTAWGTQGYQWLSQGYLKKHLLGIVEFN